MLSWLKRDTEEAKKTYLVIGLGNPGRDYHYTRHNVGFMAVDALGAQFDIRLTRYQSKAILGSGMYESSKIILAKPQTFMNLSGQAVAALVRFYKVPLDQLVVIHDDIDLPLGTLRIRPGGGSAGQKGIASTIEKLGTPDFTRMRIGIGRPSGFKEAAGYVLEEFTTSEKEILRQVLDRVAAAFRVFTTLGLNAAMNQFNGVAE